MPNRNRTGIIFVVILVLCLRPVAATGAGPALPEGTLTVCAAGCAFTTIQGAIDAARDGDKIALTDPIHTEAGIQIDKSVTLLGRAPVTATLQAARSLEEANDRVLTVTAGVSVTLDGLTLQHGHPLACPMYGGAFINNGQLTLQNCIIRNNLGQAGGGIMNAGALTLIDVTLRDNASTGTGHHGNGGGIKSMDGSLTLIDATIMNNTSHREGGGIYLSCKSTLTLINSTLSGNTAGSGGGLYVKGVAHLIHGTIFDNHALTTGGGVYIEGSRERGVIHGTMHLTNTVIASNSAGLEKYGVADCMMGNYATLGVHTNTWVEDGTCNATFAGDPELGPLRDHGDGHYVHAPEPSSPLVDAVTAAACPLETDQRGSARSGSACDIGAVELPVPQLPATVIASVGGLLGLAALSSWLLFRYRRRRAPLP